jgi:transposase
VLWSTPEGMSFLYKRLNDGKFVWPQMRDGKVCLSAAQLSMLLDNGVRSIIQLMGAICNGDSRGLRA